MSDWRFAKIGDLCKIEKGITGLANALPGKYQLVATSLERRTSSSYQFDTKAVCIPLVSSTGHGKKSLNNIHYQEGKFALGTILAAIIPYDEHILSARFLHVYLQKNKEQVIVPLMKGAANVSLSLNAISNIEIPIPPIREQNTIIEKIDSISAEHAAFISEADNQLILFNKLRQAVLQEAIEGKLSDEWRKNNPEIINKDNNATKLIEKIINEKEILVKSGNIRKEKPSTYISKDEEPFKLPDSWKWVRINDLGSSINYAIVDGPFGSHLLLTDYDINGQYPVLRIGCIDEEFDLSHMRRINKSKYEQIKRSTVRGGDIIIAKIGSSYGKLGEYPLGFPDAIIPANLLKITVHKDINKQYVKYALKSPFFKVLLDGITQFHAQPAFNVGNFKELLFPMPPQIEQQVIVDRVNNINNIIDELFKQGKERLQLSEQLMYSVLKEAFEKGMANIPH